MGRKLCDCRLAFSMGMYRKAQENDNLNGQMIISFLSWARHHSNRHLSSIWFPESWLARPDHFR